MVKSKKNLILLKTKFNLKLIRTGLHVISPIIKKDKFSPSIFSELSIPYSSNTKDILRSFDFHCINDIHENSTVELLPTIFYFHGGSWSSADKSYYTRLAKDFAEHKYVVINVNYRLLPEHSLKTVLKDCIQVMRFCLKNYKKYNIDKSNIILAGDSAGAHISALIAGWLSTSKITINCKILCCLLYYGLFDLHQLNTIKFRTLPSLSAGFEAYYGENVKQFYEEYSPINYLTPQFPYCFICSGEVDSLTVESKKFIKLLKEQNIDYTSLIFNKNRHEARHAFLNLNSPARQEAISGACVTIEKLLNSKRKP